MKSYLVSPQKKIHTEKPRQVRTHMRVPRLLLNPPLAGLANMCDLNFMPLFPNATLREGCSFFFIHFQS